MNMRGVRHLAGRGIARWMGLWLCWSALTGAASAGAEPARVIVHFKAAAVAQSASAVAASTTTDASRAPRRAAWLAQRHSLTLGDGRVIDAHRQVVIGDGTLDAEHLAATLRQDPSVEWAVPDRVRRRAAYPATAPNDPLYPAHAATFSYDVTAGQWYLRAPDSTFVSAINAQAAWATATGSGITVADIDTGVLINHPDLSGKLYAGYDFISTASNNHDTSSTHPHAGAADPGDWNTANECGANTAAGSSSWHGTQTSSVIAAATNNGVGMAGVAPDAMILPLRVLADCGGSDSDIMAAMLWAAGLPVTETQTTNPHPAKVLNLSLGGTYAGGCSSSGYPSIIQDLTNAGVVVVAAAGNDEGLAVETPGDCAGVITVGGLRHSGTKVGYSNVGTQVTLSAPAGNCVNTSGPCLYTILTATNTGTQGPSGSYTYSNTSDAALGTSFSTPMVAATAALMFQVNPSLTPAQVKSLLQSSARAFPTPNGVATCHAPNGVTQDECVCTTSTCGAGMLDVAAAVQAASPTAVPTVSIAPSATAVITGGSVTLDGSASAAPTGRSISQYSWTVNSGSAHFSGSSSQAQATLVTSGSGFVSVSLTVTDNLGTQATRTVWLASNAAATPVASISLPGSSVMAGSTLQADGSASSSGSSATLNYSWQLLQGSGIASLSGSTTSATALLQTQGNQYGDVSLALTVDDGQGHQASQVATVAVVAVHPAAALSVSSTSVVAGSTVTLDASQSAATSGRTIASYAWSIVSGSGLASFSGSTTGATATLATSSAGTVRVQVVVTDDQGAVDIRTQDITVTSAASVGVSKSSGGAVDLVSLLALATIVGAALIRTARRPYP